MGPVRSIISLAVLATFVPLGTGCAGSGFWKSKDAGWKTPSGVPTAPMSPQVNPNESGVVQAGAISQSASAIGSNVPSTFSWLTGKSDRAMGPKGPAVSIATAWQNRVDYLPDPARDGEMGPGLAGQVFLFGTRDQPATADGTLTIDLYDETKRAPGIPANKPERWQFKKDVLKTLRMVDERFGPSYVVFLPWPTYRPDVTHVRVKVRFDPDHGGFPLYAQESRFSLDTTLTPVTTPVMSTTLPMDAPNPQPFGSGQPPTGAPSGPGPGMGVFTMGGGKPAGSVSGARPRRTARYHRHHRVMARYSRPHRALAAHRPSYRR